MSYFLLCCHPLQRHPYAMVSFSGCFGDACCPIHSDMMYVSYLWWQTLLPSCTDSPGMIIAESLVDDNVRLWSLEVQHVNQCQSQLLPVRMGKIDMTPPLRGLRITTMTRFITWAIGKIDVHSLLQAFVMFCAHLSLVWGSPSITGEQSRRKHTK